MRAIVCVTLLLGGLFGGCGTPPATRTAPPPVPTDAPATTASSGAVAVDAGDPHPPMGLVDGGTVVLPSARSSLIFTDITGRTGDQTAVLFTPTAQAIEACRAGRGGKLVVRLHSEKGRLVVDPQVGSSLDPAARQCVLEALSASHIDDLGAGSNLKPMGFTSLLTIEW